MLFCRLLIFSKITFSKNSFRDTIRASNSLNPDQARHFVIRDLGTNCSQRISADDISSKRVNFGIIENCDHNYGFSAVSRHLTLGNNLASKTLRRFTLGLSK